VISDSFTPRQVALKHWAGLGTPDAVRKAADVLADFDHLRRDVVPTGAAGGRPSDLYTINPAVLGGAA
jgi:putative DNA primase/helicase